MQILQTLSTLLLLAAPLGVLAGHTIPPQARRHFELAKRAEGHVDLRKRFTDSKWSWYYPETGNAGACGQPIRNGDFAVALNAAQFNGGSECFKTITLTWGGVSHQATIMDMCPGCPYLGLDLTPGLWRAFPPIPGDGILFDGVWVFGSPAPPPPPPPPPIPTPTPTPPPPPPPPTTSSEPPPPPTSSSMAAPEPSSSSSSSSLPANGQRTGSASSSAAPRPTAAAPVGNLAALGQVFLEFASVAMDGASAARE